MHSVFILLILTASLSQAIKVQTWTLDELSKATSKCIFTDECVNHPDLVDALNTIMAALYTGKGSENVIGALPSPTGADSWTRDEILKALDNHSLDDGYRSFLLETQERFKYLNYTTETTYIISPVGLVKSETGQPKLLPLNQQFIDLFLKNNKPRT